MSSPSRVLLLGCGFAGEAIAARAREEGRAVVVTTRREDRALALLDRGYGVAKTPRTAAEAAVLAGGDTFVVVTFPPDGTTDAVIAPGLAGARAVTYLSTTGVYRLDAGPVDDSTPVSGEPNGRIRLRLAAEEAYRAVGATVLRCPGIYGPDRGLHVRVRSGAHQIPGDGSRTLSRVHVADLATFVLASERVRVETFVVGDAEPAPHIEVVRWICEAYDVREPQRVPIERVHESLRGDRKVDASRALRLLGVTLQYSTYRDGMRPPGR